MNKRPRNRPHYPPTKHGDTPGTPLQLKYPPHESKIKFRRVWSSGEFVESKRTPSPSGNSQFKQFTHFPEVLTYPGLKQDTSLVQCFKRDDSFCFRPCQTPWGLTSSICTLFSSTLYQGHSTSCCKTTSDMLLATERQPTAQPIPAVRSPRAQSPQKPMHFSFTARITSVFTKHFPQPLDEQGSIPSCFAFSLVLFIVFKFDCKSHIPMQYLKTLVSVKTDPKLHTTQPDLAVLSLFLINTSPSCLPGSWRTSLSYQQQI